MTHPELDFTGRVQEPPSKSITAVSWHPRFAEGVSTLPTRTQSRGARLPFLMVLVPTTPNRSHLSVSPSECGVPIFNIAQQFASKPHD